MKTASAICISVAGYALGTPQTARTAGEGSQAFAREVDADGVSNETTYQLPACVRACEYRLVPEHSCDVAHATSVDCCRPIDNTDLTSCIQTTCPALDDLMSWQKHRAKACNITPRDEGALLFGVDYAAFALATVSLAGRFLSRSAFMSGPGFWWDDWVVLMVWVLTLELLICQPFIYNNHGGMDVTGEVTVENIKTILRWEYVSVPFYLLGTYGTKIVLVLLYMRMWEANTTFRKVCWATIAALLTCIIGFAVGGLVILWPLRFYVGETAMVQDTYHGIKVYPAIFVTAALNVALDCWVLLMPITKLIAMRGISRSRRIGISVIFLLGFVVTVCSIVRITVIGALHTSTNLSWDIGQFGVWSEVEANLSMVTCNLPAMAGLVHRLRERYKNGMALKILSSAQQSQSGITATEMGWTAGKDDADDLPGPADFRVLDEAEEDRSRLAHDHSHIFRPYDRTP